LETLEKVLENQEELKKKSGVEAGDDDLDLDLDLSI
jgi:hypothetical protein